jgi:2-phospho-L-lactate guanylyltransferase
VVVVPVKRLEAAKSRLDRPDRGEVALAMAEDTVRAAAACPVVDAVVVVTDDERARHRLRDHATIVADEPDAGLNAALAHGAEAAAAAWPGRGVAALAADLPALRPDELERVLRAAADGGRSMVADATGTGTVLLAAVAGVPLDPRFGTDSRRVHRAADVDDLTARVGELPGLRSDVDTLAELDRAADLGVGPATRAWLPDRQATVRTWVAATGSAELVTDAGEIVPLGPGVRLDGSLRDLHPGQRVRFSSRTVPPTLGLVSETAPAPAASATSSHPPGGKMRP